MVNSIPFVIDVLSCGAVDQALAAILNCQVTVMLVSDGLGASSTAPLRQEARRRQIKYLVTTWSEDQLDELMMGVLYDGIVLLDNLTVESIADILECLALGQAVLPISVLGRMLSRPPGRGQVSDGRRAPSLTPLELQVLGFLAEGMSNKQIARRISISEHTAKRGVANVLAKLNSPNRTYAVSRAIQMGILGSSATA